MVVKVLNIKPDEFTYASALKVGYSELPVSNNDDSNISIYDFSTEEIKNNLYTSKLEWM